MAWTRVAQCGWEMGVASETPYSTSTSMPYSNITSSDPITGDHDFQQQGAGGLGFLFTSALMARCGFAFKTKGTGENVNILRWSVKDGGQTYASVQWVYGTASQMWLQYIDGDGVTVASAVADPHKVALQNLSLNCHVGCVLKVGAGGFCSFYLNGSKVIELTTGLTGISGIVGCEIGETNPGFVGMYETHFDDFYVDTSASEADEIPPTYRFVMMRPDGDGTYSQWTPLSTTNYQEVDDTVSSDAEYNYVATDSRIDTFTMDTFTLPADHSIVSAIPIVRARKSRAPSADQIRLKAYDGVSTTNGSIQNLGFGMEFFSERMLLAPDGSAWDITDINSVEFGYESI